MGARLGPPPGPRGWPLVGVSSRFKKDPLGFLLETSHEFGDVSYFRIGWKKVYFVNRPDLIDEVLVHSAKAFTRPQAISSVAFDLDSLTEAADEAVRRWQPDTPIETKAEAQRLLPAPSLPPADPNQEPKSAFDAAVSGHEEPASPVASALTWSLILLAQHEDMQERARQDVDYVQMFVTEVLRMYPPVWALARIARSQFRLFNYLVPPEGVCLVSPYVTHRHPRFWPEPDRFDPQRFGTHSGEQRPRFTYFPFGAPQICTGQDAAFAALVRVLRGVLEHWRVRLATHEPIEPCGTTPILWPRNPVSIAVSPC
jgi:cytochrome P450